MDVRIKFLGGAGSVTGSKYLLYIDDFKLLVDCGLFQGLRELRRRNWDGCPIPPSEINAIVLTHAHLDHSGYLPRLVKEGFNGPIYCTAPTADLVELLLKDSAKLQEEEAEYAKKKGYSRHENPEPLYDSKDAEQVFPMMIPQLFRKWYKISDQIEVRYHYAGHILGAASVEIKIKGEFQEKTLLFSGDIGHANDRILYDPEHPDKADIILVESTYGNREVEAEPADAKLASIINSTFENKGVVLIPAFSVGRTQNILMILKDLLENNQIPAQTTIFMDSPMAIAATELYMRHLDDHKIKEEQLQSDKSFTDLNKKLVVVQTREASNYLNAQKTDAIIISASGMMNGGRILHHLYNRLPHPNDTLVVVGYQAEGTRGRKIADGEENVKIFGQIVPIKCRVEQIDGLSAHGDQSELLDWISTFKESPKKCFMVHGEPDSAKYFAARVAHDFNWNTHVPEYLETVELFQGI